VPVRGLLVSGVIDRLELLVPVASDAKPDHPTNRATNWMQGHTLGIGSKLEITVRILATNLVELLYALVILRLFRLSPSNYKLAVFSSILVVLPVGCAVLIRISRRFSRKSNDLIDLASKLIVFVFGCSLACLSVIVWLFTIPLPITDHIIRLSLIAFACMHFGLLAAGLRATPTWQARLIFWMRYLLTFGEHISLTFSFTLIVSATMLMTFYIGVGNPFLNVIFNLIDGLNPMPGRVTLILAPMLAAAVVASCFQLVAWETGHQIRGEQRISVVRRIAMVLAVAAVAYFYFDYKFQTDVLHFLTNVGPASQIVLADSVPMVTAFSQYGPGPMAVTWLTFLVTSPSFQAANILSQLHSIAFYSVILLCLYRMTPYRLAALWLGFFAVGVLMAGWGGGNGSLNVVPSSMGMRYLPNGILVLAISFLPTDRRLSTAAFLAVVLSALWSFETLAGSVAIFGLFLLICSVRERNMAGFFRNLFAGIIAPVVVAMILTSCVTLFWAGQLPDYGVYLQFARVYNMTSEYWSLDASGAFLGWIPVAAAVMTVLTLGWLSAIDANDRPSPFCSDTLVYRFIPMAALVGFMSSYFAGRSVDFTLIISFLPLSAIIIPAMLEVFYDAMSGNGASLQLAVVPAFVTFVVLSFSFNAIYRNNSPYSTAISECLYRGNCTPSSLSKVAAQRYALRPMLDQSANPAYFDTTGLAQDAIGLIRRYAPDRKKIALFLGIYPNSVWSVYTNTILVLVGKGHRWPISYVLSDEINPLLRREIVNADVELQEGEIVFIRSDESKLGALEAEIVAKIRSGSRLCPVSPPGRLVTAYRTTLSQHCDRAM
jgi:hypothetical protein